MWAVRVGIVRRPLHALTSVATAVHHGFELAASQLPAYNAVLYAWALVALTALAMETPRGTRRWALAGLVAALPLRFRARHHFSWIREQARRNPAVVEPGV